MKAVLERRKLLMLSGVAVVAVAIVIACWSSGGRRADAKAMPRGAVATIASRPAELDRSGVLAAFNKARTALSLGALTTSACLDAQALSASISLATVPVTTSPPTPAAVCGFHAVSSGWVAGADPTGVHLIGAAEMRTSSGPSPLIATSAKHLGLALVQQRSGNALTGYVLVWMVAS